MLILKKGYINIDFLCKVYFNIELFISQDVNKNTVGYLNINNNHKKTRLKV